MPGREVTGNAQTRVVYVTAHEMNEEKISWFSNTANVNRKTGDSRGIWTRIFGNTCLPLYQLSYRVTGNGVLI